jgi:hypothetical protein
MDDPTAGYAPGHRRPLAGYATLTLTFGATMTGGLAVARATGHDPPERIRAGDVVLAGVATHKVARILAHDRVLSFVRAPFTRYQGASGHGEVEEEPRGTGLQLAVGELLVCPYCVSQWVAGGFAVGSLLAPRTTRWLSAMWTAQALGDALNLAYAQAEQRS